MVLVNIHGMKLTFKEKERYLMCKEGLSFNVIKFLLIIFLVYRF